MAVSPPIRVGIVGIGRAGWGMHRPELTAHGGFAIVAGCDLDAARCAKLAEATGAKSYTDYRELVRDPDVDLVVTATRNDTHAAVNIAALAAGKHVIAEKPFATSVAEADAVIAAAARSAGRLLVRQNRRFDPEFLHLREVLAGGAIGELQMIKLRRHWYQRRADWQTLKAFAGGLMNNWGPHIIDHGLQLLGAPVTEVWSDLRCIAAAGDAEDHLKIVLRGANGVVCDLEVSGGMAMSEPAYTIYGSQGALTCDGKRIRIRQFDREAMPAVAADAGDPPLEGGFGNPETIAWQEEELEVAPSEPTNFYTAVYRALTEESLFPISPEEARAVVWVTEQARRGTGF